MRQRALQNWGLGLWNHTI